MVLLCVSFLFAANVGPTALWWTALSRDCHAKPENLANRFGYHEFFIGADHADRHLTYRRWIATAFASVSLF
jgi:hypothetical protein